MSKQFKYTLLLLCMGAYGLSMHAQNRLTSVAREKFVLAERHAQRYRTLLQLMDRVVELNGKFYFVYPYGEVFPETNDYIMQYSTLFEYDPKTSTSEAVYQNPRGIYNLSATSQLLVFTTSGSEGFHSFNPQDKKVYSRAIFADNRLSDENSFRNTAIYTFPHSPYALALSKTKGGYDQGKPLTDYSAYTLENNYWISVMHYPNVNLNRPKYLPFYGYRPALFKDWFYTVGVVIPENSNSTQFAAWGFPLYNIKTNGPTINSPQKALDYRQLSEKKRTIISSVYSIDGLPTLLLLRPAEQEGKVVVEVAQLDGADWIVYHTGVVLSDDTSRIGMAIHNEVPYIIHKDYLGYYESKTRKFVQIAVPKMEPHHLNNGLLLFSSGHVFYAHEDTIYSVSTQGESANANSFTVKKVENFADMLTAKHNPVRAVSTSKYLYYVTQDHTLKAFNPSTGMHTTLFTGSKAPVEFRMLYAVADRIFVGGRTGSSEDPQYEIFTISDAEVKE